MTKAEELAKDFEDFPHLPRDEEAAVELRRLEAENVELRKELAHARAKHPVLDQTLTGQALIDNYAAVGRAKLIEQERAELLAFLNGEGPYEGVWFGGMHPTERGAFWWRKHLHRLFSNNYDGEV